MDEENDFWSKEDINRLIEGFRTHDVLWNTKNNAYMKRAQRDRAMKAIAATITGKVCLKYPFQLIHRTTCMCKCGLTKLLCIMC